MTELEKLVAQQEILQVVAKYCMYMDNAEFDAFEALWAEDAVFDVSPNPGIVPVPASGRRRIREICEERHEHNIKTVLHRHAVSNTVFDELTADGARVRSQVTMSEIVWSAGMIALRGTGEYRDRFVRRGGRWLFAERVLVLDMLGGWRPGAGGDPDAARKG
jgi:3-phenylpropionate/cinnamic acid dioxygenase small subunit